MKTIKNIKKFADVPVDERYTPFVWKAWKEGLINGYQDGTFRPSGNVSTAEFLKITVHAHNLDIHLEYDYTDISTNDWIDPYAGAAKKYNLFPERINKLRPHEDLIRWDTAVVIYQALKNND